jgi:DNA recombination protein RmuC
MTGFEVAMALGVPGLCALGVAVVLLQRRLSLHEGAVARAQAAEAQLTQARAGLQAAGAELSQARERESRLSQERAALAATLQGRDEALREARGAVAALQEQQQAREAGLQRALSQERAALEVERRTRADAESQLGRLEALLSSERARAAREEQQAAQVQARLKETFAALSGQALQQSQGQFLQLAEARFAQLHEKAQGELSARQQAIGEALAPLQKQLERMDGQLQQLEVGRAHQSSQLVEMLKSLGSAQDGLRTETQRLVQALRAPQTRGRWAELHLRRVVELAGLQERCDFVEQATVASEEGTLRPDLVVHLPGDGRVVVDAKAPLLAWLDASQSGGTALLEEAQRREVYLTHARQVRAHVQKLADKAYWSQFEKAPDFVVLFLPTEAALGAALEADPDLHEAAISRHVLLATPMTLIALLRTVAYGWRQDAMAKGAREIADQGRLLYRRLGTLAGHFSLVGRSLHKAVEAFNESVGSLERAVLPAARRLKETQAAAGEAELPLLPVVETVPRQIQAPELLPELPEAAN